MIKVYNKINGTMKLFYSFSEAIANMTTEQDVIFDGVGDVLFINVEGTVYKFTGDTLVKVRL